MTSNVEWHFFTKHILASTKKKVSAGVKKTTVEKMGVYKRKSVHKQMKKHFQLNLRWAQHSETVILTESFLKALEQIVEFKNKRLQWKRLRPYKFIHLYSHMLGLLSWLEPISNGNWPRAGGIPMDRLPVHHMGTQGRPGQIIMPVWNEIM